MRVTDSIFTPHFHLSHKGRENNYSICFRDTILGFSRALLYKPGEGAVVGALYLGREDAGGKLIHLKVIPDAFTAFAFPGARLVGAGAPGFVYIKIAFHQV